MLRTIQVLRYKTVALEGVVALSAFGGGGVMIADPQGAMGLPGWMRERLPLVDSWLVPGIALVACNGVLPAVNAVAELRGQAWPREWGHVTAGAVLLAWPVGETVLFGYPLEGEPRWLRPGVAAAGVTLMALGLLLRRSSHAG